MVQKFQSVPDMDSMELNFEELNFEDYFNLELIEIKFPSKISTFTVLALDMESWAFKVYRELVFRDMDTKWRKENRKINRLLETTNCTHDLFQWSVKDWEKGIESKKSLSLYPSSWTGKKKNYIDKSKGSKFFFKMITGTLVRKYEEENKVCRRCNAVGPEEVHVIFECPFMAEIRDRLDLFGTLSRCGSISETQVRTRASDRTFLKDLLDKVENKQVIGELIGNIFNAWLEGVYMGWVLGNGSTNAPPQVRHLGDQTSTV